MGKPTREERDRRSVQDMIIAGENILRFAKGGKAKFLDDDMVRSAIERQFEIFGEAATRASLELSEAHPEIPWRTVIGFRNMLIHGYDKIGPERVWDALAPLRQALDGLRTLRDG